MQSSLKELATLVGAELGDPSSANYRITGFADLLTSREGDISFFSNPRYLPQLKQTQAGAVLVPRTFEAGFPESRLLRVDNPSTAFARIVEAYSPPKRRILPGIHPRAVVHESALLDPENVTVSAGAVIEADVVVGNGTFIGSNAVIHEGVRIGNDCRIHANVTIREHCILGDRVSLHAGAVVGSDGFGYEFTDGRHQKIEQVGIVELGNDVEIGANSTIDRARFGKTRIGEGTKIDNLVQVGHNVDLGRHVIVVAQTGLAGSCRIGDGVVIAAQSGVAGHIEVGDRSILAARSGVTKSLPGKEVYMGYPAQPAGKARKEIVFVSRLGEFFQRLKALEKKVMSSQDK